MCGILTQSDNLKVLTDFWNSMSCNAEGLIEFSIESKVKLLAHMLGQAYIYKKIDEDNFDDDIHSYLSKDNDYKVITKTN